MAFSVSRSIKQGFKAANRSIPAMGIFGLGWLLLSLMMLLFAAISGVPDELMRQPDAQQAQEQTASPDAKSADSGTIDVTTSAVEQDGQAQDAGLEAAAVEAQRLAETALNWLVGAWPVLLLAVLGFIVGSLWLQAGQISYMALRIRDSQVPLSVFWVGANRAVLPLCLAALLTSGVYAIGATLILAFFLLLGALPGFLAVLFSVLLVLVFFVGLIWVSVKLVFWFVSIVIDHLGPVTGLKASFLATKSCWWRTWGLVAALGGISFGVSLAVGIFAQLGSALGGGVGFAVSLFVFILNLIVGLYLGFFTTGAFVQSYTDQTKAA